MEGELKQESLGEVVEEIRDLLREGNEFLETIATSLKPYDFFDRITISVEEAHDKVKIEFVIAVLKIIVLPIPADFVLWVDNYMSEKNKYEFNLGESMTIDRECRRIFYSNDANSGVKEKARIHIFGRW